MSVLGSLTPCTTCNLFAKASVFMCRVCGAMLPTGWPRDALRPDERPYSVRLSETDSKLALEFWQGLQHRGNLIRPHPYFHARLPSYPPIGFHLGPRYNPWLPRLLWCQCIMRPANTATCLAPSKFRQITYSPVPSAADTAVDKEVEGEVNK